MYTFYIDDELSEGLKRVKEKDGISESEQIRRAIRAWLDQRDGNEKAAPRRVSPRRKA